MEMNEFNPTIIDSKKKYVHFWNEMRENRFYS